MSVMESDKNLAAFEKGVQLMFEKKNQEALEAFESIVADPGTDRTLSQTAAIYARACRARLAPPPPKPETAQELLDHAVYHMNRSEFAEAEKLSAKAIKAGGEGEVFYYIHSAILAQANKIDEALDTLEKAIHLEPSNRGRARLDSDMEPLFDNDRFEKMTEDDR